MNPIKYRARVFIGLYILNCARTSHYRDVIHDRLRVIHSWDPTPYNCSRADTKLIRHWQRFRWYYWCLDYCMHTLSWLANP